MSHHEAFGLLSILMMLCSRANYFNSIFRGKTHPHVFSWLIWGVMSGVGVAAQIIEGAGAGSWARLFSSATCFIMVVIAMFWGEKHIRRSDWITLMVALATIPLWVITKTPVWSVIIVCIIDTLGYIPTVTKSWSKPHQEAVVSYCFSCAGALFSVLAVEHYTLSTWLYSAVLTASNGMMAAYLLIRRHQLRA